MKPKRVIIADDDAGFANVMKLRCTHLGLEVQTAPDAMFALTLVHKDPPDLVLLDVNMPAGNGLAVCEMLKTDRRLGSMPIIVITGIADDDTLERCEAMDVKCFLKSTDLWERLGPVICHTLGIKPPAAAKARR